MLDPMDAEACDIALELAGHCARLFPDWWQEHAAHVPATGAVLARLCQTFMRLVDERLFMLEESLEESMAEIQWYSADTSTLRTDWDEAQDGDPLVAIAESSYTLRQPTPVFFGLGAATAADGDDDSREQSLLTLALWQLLRRTRWSLGYDVLDLAAHLPPAQQRLLAELEPLAPSADVVALVALTWNGRPWGARLGQLIAYAVAEHENPLTRLTYGELLELYDGQHDFTWDDAEKIAAWSKDAIALSNDYAAWERAVNIDPTREVAAIATLLYGLFGKAQETDGTLISVLDLSRPGAWPDEPDPDRRELEEDELLQELYP